MNGQTFFILLAVLVGSFHLARLGILAIAYAAERLAYRLPSRAYDRKPPIRSLDDVIDFLTVRDWIAPPRRRLAQVR